MLSLRFFPAPHTTVSRRARGHRPRKTRSKAAPARVINSQPLVPCSIARRSSSRTSRARYKAWGNSRMGVIITAMKDAQKAEDFSPRDGSQLARDIKRWGGELGFQQIGVADTELSSHEAHLQRWLNAGHHGEMDYMARHGSKRSHPTKHKPTTKHKNTTHKKKKPKNMHAAEAVLARADLGYV